MDLKKLDIKSDNRGFLVEAFKFPTDGQLLYVITKPDEMRGGHYHLRKTERFLVIWGGATIVVKDRSTDDVMAVKVTGQKPLVVTIVPNHTHEIVANDEGAIFLVWVSEQFNPDDPDTYPEEI